MSWEKTEEDYYFDQWIDTNYAYSPDEGHEIQQCFENLRQLGLSQRFPPTTECSIS